MGSQEVYDLTGSYAHVELVSAGNQSLASLEIVPMELVLDTDNLVQWLITDGTIYARKKVATVSTTVASTAYNSSTHRWLKIRESGGTIYYETSTDGVSWNAFGNTTVAFDYTGIEYGLTAGTWANEGVGSAMHVDNINIPGAGGGDPAPDDDTVFEVVSAILSRKRG